MGFSEIPAPDFSSAKFRPQREKSATMNTVYDCFLYMTLKGRSYAQRESPWKYEEQYETEAVASHRTIPKYHKLCVFHLMMIHINVLQPQFIERSR